MAEYYGKIGEMTPDNLIANLNVRLISVSGTVAAGSGAVKRGTVMGLNADGTLAVYVGADAAKKPTKTVGQEGDTPNVNDEETAAPIPYGIMCDDVVADDGNVVAEVYIAGSFNKNALIVAEDYELTAEDAQILRNGGIYLENAAQI